MSADPLAGLESSHEGIEARLATLEKLAAHLTARQPDGIAKVIARDVVRYFDGEVARHHADEDGDLKRRWQRLREKLHAVVAGASPAFDEDEIVRFAWIYRRHIERETRLVLPFAREVLPPPE